VILNSAWGTKRFLDVPTGNFFQEYVKGNSLPSLGFVSLDGIYFHR